MTEQFCEHESSVIRATRSGTWEPSLRSHVDTCAVCREAVKVVSAMNTLLSADAAQMPLIPDPRRLWLKASFAERQKRSELVSRIAGVAYAGLVAVVGFGVYSFIKSQIAQPTLSLPSSDIATSAAGPVILVVVSIVVVLLLTSATARRSG